MRYFLLIRSRSTNITRVFVIHRVSEERQERPQEGCHCIFTTLCVAGRRNRIIIPLLIKLSCVEGAGRDALLVWHSEQTPRRVIDVGIWCMGRQAASTLLLAAGESDYACTRETETFFPRYDSTDIFTDFKVDSNSRLSNYSRNICKRECIHLSHTYIFLW